jgi:hypothetical protein
MEIKIVNTSIKYMNANVILHFQFDHSSNYLHSLKFILMMCSNLNLFNNYFQAKDTMNDVYFGYLNENGFDLIHSQGL